MEKVKNSLSEGKTSKEYAAGRNIILGRWLVLLLILPLFYCASSKSISFFLMLKLLIGLSLYNVVITLYIQKEYPRTSKLPEYFYYVDSVIITVFSFIMGGINSDIYVIYMVVIALHGVCNNLVNTMKLAFSITGMYSLSSIIVHEIADKKWLISSGMVQLIVRDIAIVILTFAIGVIISETKKAGTLHRLEYLKARTDKLTGLPNRHFMEQWMEEEISDCEANGKYLNVLIFDIDNFKKCNDNNGHLFGDDVLKRFAEILEQSVRKSDLPVRYGGEEFVVLIKDIDFVTAKSVGDRVRRGLEREKLFIESTEHKTRITVSCGVAQYPTHSPNIKDVIELADKALYCAKRNGKNIVIGYDEMMEMEELYESDEKLHLQSVN